MKTECVIWPQYKDRAGYGTTYHEGRVRKAHRVAYCLFHNIAIESIDGLLVRHDCDNPSCVNPEHLSLGNHKDNTADRIKRNRSYHPSGEKNIGSKLSEEQIAEIRAIHIPRKKGFSTSCLAKKYGVSPSWIGRVIAGNVRNGEAEGPLFLTFEGKTQTPYEWSEDERVKIGARAIIERKRKGMSDADALFAPARKWGGRKHD